MRAISRRRSERSRQTNRVRAADLLWAQPVFGRGRHGLAPLRVPGGVAPAFPSLSFPQLQTLQIPRKELPAPPLTFSQPGKVSRNLGLI